MLSAKSRLAKESQRSLKVVTMQGEEADYMLKAGERAPEFTLPDDAGVDRSLTDFLSSGTTILYFYPSGFMPGCQRQACALRDMYAEIEQSGMRVVGVSPQSSKSHARFRAKYQIPFMLLSDRQKTVIKMYGLLGPLGLGVRRTTLLIDGSRRIRDLLRADILIGRHLAFVRKAVMLRSGNGAAGAGKNTRTPI
jgi:thioredoxin-dependent peroxiredoxin